MANTILKESKRQDRYAIFKACHSRY